jgi:hypothetical protein
VRFFDTLQREWPLLDALRLDKYYYLLTQVQREYFRFLARRRWSAPLAHAIRDALLTSVLEVSGISFAGISLALARHFSSSLHAVARDERSDPGAALAVLVEPLLRFFALSIDKRFVDLAAEALFEPLLTADPVSDRFGASSLRAVAELADSLASDRSTPINGRRRQFLYSVISRIQSQIRAGETPRERLDAEPEPEEQDDEEEGVANGHNDKSNGNDIDHQHRMIQNDNDDDDDDNDDDDEDDDDDNDDDDDDDDPDDLDSEENQAPPIRRFDTPKPKKQQQQQTPPQRTPTKKVVDTPPNQSPVMITATPQKKVLARVDSEVSIDLTPKPGKKAIARLDSEVSIDMTPKPKKKARLEDVAEAVPSAASEVVAKVRRRVSWGAAHERDFHHRDAPTTVAGQATRENTIKTHKKRTMPFLPVSARMQFAQQQQRNQQLQRQRKRK